ncbi:MAG: YlxR family protein [Oscillospiraceae bacterium]|nr:YlxR family protein [Oscillospiraceae bacterium]
MKPKKIPLRKCNGCGEQKDKRELVRIVKNANGEINLDVSGKMPGRGAYICPSIECLKKARKSRRIDKAFECTVPSEVYDKLEEQLKNNG